MDDKWPDCEIVVAGTGHRPQKLGGYGKDVFSRLVALAEKEISRLKPEKVLSGMALGWDQALAQAAINLGVPFVAVCPFKGMDAKWPKESQEYFQELLGKAARIVYVCDDGYSVWKLRKRNECLVDNCNVLLALWDGSPSGTEHCVRYAQKNGEVTIVNLWNTWEKKGEEGER